MSEKEWMEARMVEFLCLSFLLSVGADVAGTSQRVKLEKRERKNEERERGKDRKECWKGGFTCL